MSYLYVLWTLLTLIPALSPGRPAPSHLSFLILHYVTLGYSALEILFSIYYRFLAIRANARRASPQYTRRYLRSVLKRSLENGLSPEDAEDEAMDAMGLGELSGGAGAQTKGKETGRKSTEQTPEMRQRRSQLGDGSATPELGSSRQLEPVRTNRSGATDDEGYGESLRSHGDGNGGAVKPGYVPSFISPALTPDDPRAADFRNFIRLWFNGCDYEDIRRLNMADWLAWSLYGQPLHELEEERKQWHAEGKPPLHVDGELDVDDEGLDIDADKLGLVGECSASRAFRAALTCTESCRALCRAR